MSSTSSLTPNSPEQLEYLMDLLKRRQANIDTQRVNEMEANIAKQGKPVSPPPFNKPSMPDNTPIVPDPEGVRDVDINFAKPDGYTKTMQTRPQGSAAASEEAALASQAAKKAALGKILGGFGGNVIGATVGHLADPPEAGAGSDVPVGPQLTADQIMEMYKKQQGQE